MSKMRSQFCSNWFDDSGYGICAAATPDDSPDGVPTVEPGLDGGPDESANEGCPTASCHS